MIDETSDLSVYEKNSKILYKELKTIGFTCREPGGTFCMFPKALEEDAVAFCQKALEYNLVLVPGDCIVYSPHIGGITTSSMRKAHRMLWQEFEDMTNGKRPKNVVNG